MERRPPLTGERRFGPEACPTCGRWGGHAEWCSDINAWLREISRRTGPTSSRRRSRKRSDEALREPAAGRRGTGRGGGDGHPSERPSRRTLRALWSMEQGGRARVANSKELEPKPPPPLLTVSTGSSPSSRIATFPTWGPSMFGVPSTARAGSCCIPTTLTNAPSYSSSSPPAIPGSSSPDGYTPETGRSRSFGGPKARGRLLPGSAVVPLQSADPTDGGDSLLTRETDRPGRRDLHPASTGSIVAAADYVEAIVPHRDDVTRPPGPEPSPGTRSTGSDTKPSDQPTSVSLGSRTADQDPPTRTPDMPRFSGAIPETTQGPYAMRRGCRSFPHGATCAHRSAPGMKKGRTSSQGRRLPRA